MQAQRTTGESCAPLCSFVTLTRVHVRARTCAAWIGAHRGCVSAWECVRVWVCVFWAPRRRPDKRTHTHARSTLGPCPKYTLSIHVDEKHPPSHPEQDPERVFFCKNKQGAKGKTGERSSADITKNTRHWSKSEKSWSKKPTRSPLSFHLGARRKLQYDRQHDS